VRAAEAQGEDRGSTRAEIGPPEHSTNWASPRRAIGGEIGTSRGLRAQNMYDTIPQLFVACFLSIYVALVAALLWSGLIAGLRPARKGRGIIRTCDVNMKG
jgi:hypothetical protein